MKAERQRPGQRGRSSRLPDDSVGTLSKLLCHGVSLIDNKILVEDLEDLSSLKVGHGVGISS